MAMVSFQVSNAVYGKLRALGIDYRRFTRADNLYVVTRVKSGRTMDEAYIDLLVSKNLLASGSTPSDPQLPSPPPAA